MRSRYLLLFHWGQLLGQAAAAISREDLPVGSSTASAAFDPVNQCGHTPAGMARMGGIFACPRLMQPLDVGVDDQTVTAARWLPWTHPPFCANTTCCVFTNAAFQTRGLSIVAAPEALASAQGQLELAFAAPPLRSPGGLVEDNGGDDREAEEDGQLSDGASTRNRSSSTKKAGGARKDKRSWDVRDIPGKGKGMLATRSIRRGETIMIDYASVLVSVAFPGRVSRAQGNQILARAVAQLARPEAVTGLARSSKAGAAPLVEDVLRTNTFSLTIDDEPYMGLFPAVSRINHACAPNAQTRFSARTLSQKVIAFLDIEPGEEITISYSEFGMTYKKRQQVLLSRWGFKCACSLCSSAAHEIAASDARRERAESVRDRVMDLIRKGQLAAAIDHSKLLIDISVREGLVSGLGDHYELLARLHKGAGDLEGAGKYARLALEEMRASGGREEFDAFGELELFVEQLDARSRRSRIKT